VSVRVSTWAWQQPVGGHRKLVLLAVADQANDGGVCWPSQTSLARKCGISERRLRDHLAELEEGGYISRAERRRDDGTRSSDLYALLHRTILPVRLDPTGRYVRSHRTIRPNLTGHSVPPLTVIRNRQGNRGPSPSKIAGVRDATRCKGSSDDRGHLSRVR